MERFDVFVIGGGGTGSEVAFSLARSSDLKVALAERDKLGGECNHYGCVPTKVMLRSAKIAALARDGARFGLRIPEVAVDFAAVQRRAHAVIDAHSGESAAPFVLASGTEATIPPIPGLADGPRWTNKEAIWGPTEPPTSLTVIGSGAIGIEFAQIYARFGSRVTVLEALPSILPAEDAEAAATLVPAFEEEGIELLPGVKITEARHGSEGWTIDVEGHDHLHADEVLVATGRRPMFDPHDLDAAGVELHEAGDPILTDTLRTTNPSIWAAGDATGELLFTHVGTYEAELVVKDILGHPEARDYRVVPRVTFCDPEVGSVGLTERQSREEGHDVVTAVARFEDNERALIEGRTHGLVKLVAERRTGELLGGHIVGEEAGALIHEVVGLMAVRANAPTVARAIHAYPTMSESVRSALLGIEERVG
jgi:pyruvate/2-oxoglutarate dehydrogenase complex dihydrolipoamide dehydrogenase (E3) component